MPDSKYEIFGPYASLDISHQGFYLIEAFYNRHTNSSQYHVFNAEHQNDDFKLLPHHPEKLYLADSIGFYCFELNSMNLKKTSLRQIQKDKFKKMDQCSVQKYDFENNRFQDDLESTSEMLEYTGKRDLTLIGQLKNISLEKVRENILINDEYLFKKYKNHFDPVLFYKFWQALMTSYCKKQKYESLDADFRNLNTQNPGFLMSLWQRIYEKILKLLGYEVRSFNSFKSELEKSNFAIYLK